jgi:hypothetical protein
MEMHFDHTVTGQAILIPAEGRLVRWPITAHVTDPALPFDMDVRIVGDGIEDPILVCDELHIYRRPGGPPVTSSALRAIPLREIIEETRDKCVEPWPQPDPETWNYGVGASNAFTRRAPRKSRRTILENELGEVAEVWNAAASSGARATTQAVADHFNVSRATAARAVKKAREKKLVPEV